MDHCRTSVNGNDQWFMEKQLRKIGELYGLEVTVKAKTSPRRPSLTISDKLFIGKHLRRIGKYYGYDLVKRSRLEASAEKREKALLDEGRKSGCPVCVSRLEGKGKATGRKEELNSSAGACPSGTRSRRDHEYSPQLRVVGEDSLETGILNPHEQEGAQPLSGTALMEAGDAGAWTQGLGSERRPLRGEVQRITMTTVSHFIV